MKQYLTMLSDIKSLGTRKGPARKNMPGTISLFGYRIEHDLADGFPLLTTKKLSFKNIATELCWILRGDTNIKYLLDNGCNIWNEDAYNFYKMLHKEITGTDASHSLASFVTHIKEGNLKASSLCDPKHGLHYSLGDTGFLYGKQLRDWNNDTDQIQNVLTSLKTNPESRRHLLTVINPAVVEYLALYWCNVLTQFNCRQLSYEQRCKLWKGLPLNLLNGEIYITNLLDLEKVPKYYLDCQFYARSSDAFLGCPYDFASHALLTHILAKMTNMIPGKVSQAFGDVHIYENHLAQVDEQLQRKPLPLPELIIHTDIIGLDAIKPEFFSIANYESWAPIKAKLSTGLI